MTAVAKPGGGGIEMLFSFLTNPNLMSAENNLVMLHTAIFVILGLCNFSPRLIIFSGSTHGRRNQGSRPPQKIFGGGPGGRFLGEKTSSFNQYRTMLAYMWLIKK